MIPISRKIMMSFEFSITKAIMEFTLIVAGFAFSLLPGVKISTRPGCKCELDHRRLIRFHPDWNGEGVFLPLHPRCRTIGGVFYFDLLVSRKAPLSDRKMKH